jgi:hypothetical protein
MSKRWGTAVVVLAAGCASYPPERVERDRLIMAAIEPCKARHNDQLFNPNMMSVNADGRVRYFYKGDQIRAPEEIGKCLDDATKGLKLGPWRDGRLGKPGPAVVPITPSGKQDLLVEVRINGAVGRLAIGTSAPLTIISPAFGERAGLRPVAESPLTHAAIGGRNVTPPYVRAGAVEVGEASVQALDIVVYDAYPAGSGVDGILCSTFLSNFKLDIDRKANRLTLEGRQP